MQDRLLEVLLFNDVLKNLVFFHLPIKKIGFTTLKMSILNSKSLFVVDYRKKVEFIFYHLIFNSNFLNF